MLVGRLDVSLQLPRVGDVEQRTIALREREGVIDVRQLLQLLLAGARTAIDDVADDPEGRVTRLARLLARLWGGIRTAPRRQKREHDQRPHPPDADASGGHQNDVSVSWDWPS